MHVGGRETLAPLDSRHEAGHLQGCSMADGRRLRCLADAFLATLADQSKWVPSDETDHEKGAEPGRDAAQDWVDQVQEDPGPVVHEQQMHQPAFPASPLEAPRKR